MSVPGFSRRRFPAIHGARRRGGRDRRLLAAARPPPVWPGRSAAAKALPEGWTGTIADVKHVVILMQENRSFDHYFGTLHGVRGFGDKQVLTYQNGTQIFQQPDTARTDLGYLLPYNLTDQTDGDLDHSWDGDHEGPERRAVEQLGSGQDRRDDGLLHPERDPVPVRGRRRLHHLRRLPPGDHGAHQPQPDVLLDRDVVGLDQQPERLRGRLRTRRRDARGHHLPRAAAEAAGISWRVYTNDQVGDSGSYPDYFLGDYGDNPLWFYQQYNTTNSRRAAPASSRPAGRSPPGRPTRGRRR
jgi:phospholipase C